MSQLTNAIGIDLGTTYSRVRIFRNGMAEIIANDQGNRATPSYVAFTDTERLIGDAAKNQVAMNPQNTVFDAKRLIGRRFDDAAVQSDMKLWPFRLVDEGTMPMIEVEYKGEPKSFSPEEISSMILAEMKEIAEAYLGRKVTDAVITVPAYFDISQRDAISKAGEMAGLNVLQTVKEPIAAATAYGFHNPSVTKIILIFDLGGSTCNASILLSTRNTYNFLTVMATTCDAHLGGKDFDSRMVNHFIQEFKRKHNMDITNDRRAIERLRRACERAKETLSSSNQARIEIDSLFEGINLCSSITRAKFEDLCADLFSSTLIPVEKSLRDARYSKTHVTVIDKDDIDKVILVGGSSRIPKIQEMLRDFFNGKEINIIVDPDEAVACGAAVEAANIEALRKQCFIDIVPLSLGIGTGGGVMTTLIDREVTIPTKHSAIFYTLFDNQTCMAIQVFEGERPLAQKNNFLGVLELSGIPPAPCGVEEVEVTFNVYFHQWLDVLATVKSTGEKNKITVRINLGLYNRDYIERMVEEAEEYKDDDRKQTDRIEAKTGLESFAFNLKQTCEDEKLKVKIPAGGREKVLNEVEKTLAWLAGNQMAEPEEFADKQRELEQLSAPIMIKMYQFAGGDGGVPPELFPGRKGDKPGAG